MVINQFHAIGDILFIEPICRHFWIITGEKPILPIRDHLMWLANYIESADFRPMSKFELDYESIETSNPSYLPLRFANQILRNLEKDDHSDFSNTMPDKYELLGIHSSNWLLLDLRFDLKKCRLLYEKVNPNSEPYILVNEHSQAGIIPINPKTDLKVIKMHQIEGFTVLDWALLMLFATENHHVSTCTFYILQAIANKFPLNSKIFIYPRPNADGLLGISKLNPTFEWTAVINGEQLSVAQWMFSIANN